MQVLVREMQPNEKGDVEKLFARSLGVTDRIIFQLSFEGAQKSARKQSGGTLTAEYDSKIVGAVSMRIQTVTKKRTGYIDALVTDKELRGRAIGKSLVDGAISWLEEHGCEVIYATAARYNSHLGTFLFTEASISTRFRNSSETTGSTFYDCGLENSIS